MGGMSDHEQPTHVTGTATGTGTVKRGMAEMLKGGVIMDVVTAEQAKIAEDAGAVAVMALERVPADIRAEGGVSRMSDPDMIEAIINTVSIPVMAKARIGHFVEAQILQSLGVHKVRLLTNNPEKPSALELHGIEVDERVPLQSQPNEHNLIYLQTKRLRMGHLLENI